MTARIVIGLLLFAPLAGADVAQLQRLAEARQLFLLREALQQPGWDPSDTLFYRGMVESRFGQESKGIGDLTRFLATNPSRARRLDAYDELAFALVRQGRYSEAARNLTEVLRLAPPGERTENANRKDLLSTLSGTAPQSVAFGDDVPVRATFNPLGSWNVPLEVNGRRSEWIFDTGANWSTVTKSEAERLGLRIRESGAYVSGSTGKKNPLRLAVASNLELGRAHLKNVILLVLSDETLFIGPLKYQTRGILGLPAIRALGRVGIGADGDLRIDPRRAAAGAPNLFFNGLTPVVEVAHGGRRTLMFLDTGANTSFFYPSFRPALTKDEIAGLTFKDEKIAGAGEIVVRRTEVLPTLRLSVAGRPLNLSKVSVLTSAPQGDARYRDGVLGSDAMRGGFTLDWRVMQLRLE